MGLFLFGNKGRREEQEAQFRRRIEEQLSKLIEGKEEEQRLLDALSGGVRQAGADIRKHNMALEDCLDVLEEQQEAETQSRKKIKELEEMEEKMLRLLETYQEQVWNMSKYAAEHDPAWTAQLELTQEVVKGAESGCGIRSVDESDVKVDYTLHEVIEIRDTEEKEKSQTVAEVFCPGCVYKGVTRKKAKIAAYRYIQTRGNTP